MTKLLLILLITIFTISCGEAVGDGSGADGVGSSQHRIFVTSTTHTGNLGGLDGADTICANLANAQGLELTYKSFLGSNSTRLLNRFSFSGAVYNISNGDRFKVVDLGSELFEADIESLKQLIEYDETGASVSGLVWTGSDSEGQNTSSVSCTDWTTDSGAVNGSVGDNTRTSGFYLEDLPNQNCSLSYRLYCISI